MTDMANPLAAASMLLAIVAVLFGAWTGDVGKAIDLRFAPQVDNRDAERALIRSVLYTKALPLTIGALLAACVFFWRAAGLILGAIDCKFSTTCTYDDVGAAFALTEAFVIVVAISATRQLVQLIGKLRKSHIP